MYSGSLSSVRLSVPTSRETGSVSARVQAAAGRVQGQLADGDAHAAGALVAEAQDALVVGDDDEAHVGVGRVAQQLRHAVDVIGRDPDAAGAPQDVAELLAGLAHGRGVDHRHELLEVVGQEPVEERRVAVLQGRQADVLLERVLLARDVLPLELDLLLDGLDPVGQHAAQPEGLALVLAEGEVLGEEACAQQLEATQVDLGRAARRRWRRRVPRVASSGPHVQTGRRPGHGRGVRRAPPVDAGLSGCGRSAYLVWAVTSQRPSGQRMLAR